MVDTNVIPVGRLAPSPTGAQHVGNARTYLLAWLSIRSRSGRIVLRIEDIDSPRVKSGAALQILEDLNWLGLDWDEGPDLGGPSRPYVQTERMELYRIALKELQNADRIYPCTCTRTDVAVAASAPHVGQEGPRYPGTCAGRTVDDAKGLGDVPFSWRFRTTNSPHQIIDQVKGHANWRVLGELGDFVVGKRDETPAYQLAVVVDDHMMGINEVVRGDDLLPSTGRQLELYQFFQWQPPSFAHVPLVVGGDGRRLAKRHGDTRLATLRQQGVTSEQLIGFLAWSCGLLPKFEPCRPDELLTGFELRKITKTPFVFDESDLR